ncbi:MAG TPA: hypothetical protein VN956_23720 [Pyrinomonadaceae bacterium]|nr:hypothetical protein [Pyrinomonadaceae bacterium]
MGSPKIPTNYTIGFNLNTVDCFDFCIKELPVIHLAIDQIPLIQTDSKIDAKTDSKIDAKTDSVIRIKELPQIDLQFGVRPTKVHLPMHTTFGLCVLGVQVLCFDICGENMVIIEDYKPLATEKCD